MKKVGVRELTPTYKPRGKFMKKVKSEMTDELRPEYKRSDLGKIVRGKYANRIKAETNVVLLEPDIAQAR